jgi:hypothetical protein
MDIEIITGEKLQQLADIYLGTLDDFCFNDLINIQKHKHENIENLVDYFDNPKIIFCYSHRVQLFSQKIEFFKNPFVLLTHNSDTNITEAPEIYKILDTPNLIKWYTQNLCMKHKKLHYLPIGLANSMWAGGDLQIFKTIDTNTLHIKTKQIYFNFTIDTNYNKRIECYNTFNSKIPFLDRIRPTDNLNRLKEYEFCLCPQGNGMDTHRFWECVYLKVVPIVINSMFIQNIKEYNIPMVILNKWDDLFNLNLNYTNYDFNNIKIYVSDFIKMIK